MKNILNNFHRFVFVINFKVAEILIIFTTTLKVQVHLLKQLCPTII
jgi:hypothetical protein